MIALPESWPLLAVVALFVGAAVAIAFAGTRMARVADQLADRTGMGEALAGALFLGGVTSFPGLMTTTVTALEGLPTLAVSNAVGSIAVQTLWLVIGDLMMRRANLEHVAASPENMLQGALLVALLSIALLAMNGPAVTLGWVHPASFALLVCWGFGMRLVRGVRRRPMWQPTVTEDTRVDEPEAAHEELSLWKLWWSFGLLAAVLGGAGFLLAQTGASITARTPLSESFVGGFFTAAASSIPELVVVIAAVRSGAYTLAVSNIIGGNALDTLFLLFADIGYRPGSIYHAVSSNQQFLLVLTVFMTAFLLMGLVRRERTGWWRIGFESVVVALAYLGSLCALAFMGTTSP